MLVFDAVWRLEEDKTCVELVFDALCGEWQLVDEAVTQNMTEPVSSRDEPVSAVIHWGCSCTRGQSWDQAGLGDQDGFKGNFGVVLPPDESDLREWLLGVLFGIHGGLCVNGMYNGGWWWDRSVKVKWTDVDEPLYYRAGDDGAYDLWCPGPWFPVPKEPFILQVCKVRDLIYSLLDKASRNQLPIPDYAEETGNKQLQIDALRASTSAFAADVIARMYR